MIINSYHGWIRNLILPFLPFLVFAGVKVAGRGNGSAGTGIINHHFHPFPSTILFPLPSPLLPDCT
jgi:hypothetical protein